MNIRITVEDIDTDHADPENEMGVTEAAYLRIIDSLSWLGDVHDVDQEEIQIR